ncbi:MAG: chromate transporter [Alistipes sp.]|nr:chromate transporter [Candidatus Alistipes equi]
MIYLELFLAYLKIGFFGFGGGYAMLSLIYNEIVVQHAWLTASEFSDIVAISQITPGPIAINSATYVGYMVAGVWGSVLSTIAVCMPSISIMMLVSVFYLRLKDNDILKRIIAFMKPVVVSMILSAVLLLMFPSEESSDFENTWSWLIFSSVLYGLHKKQNPILLLIYAALAGIVIYYCPALMASLG